MKKKAIIISIKSYKLSNKEVNLLANENPWGLILFKRNIKSIPQLKILILKMTTNLSVIMVINCHHLQYC